MSSEASQLAYARRPSGEKAASRDELVARLAGKHARAHNSLERNTAWLRKEGPEAALVDGMIT